MEWTIIKYVSVFTMNVGVAVDEGFHLFFSLALCKNALHSCEKFSRKTLKRMLTAPQTQSGYFRS